MIHPKYIQCDLFSSAHYQKHEPVIIAHVCNDLGLWATGFASTFKRRYQNAFDQFKPWFESERRKGSMLGKSQLVTLIDNNGASLYGCNMIAQSGLYNKSRNPNPLQYDSLQLCLSALERFCKHSSAIVYMPKIASNPSYSDWGYVYDMIVNNLSIRDVVVNIFEVD